MAGITRRELLRGTAAATALTVLGGDAHAQKAATAPAPGRLQDIDHIIVLMKENRSFDHYFGSLSGVRGFGDARAMKLGNGRSVFHQTDPERRDGYVLPFHVDTRLTDGQRFHGLSHSWEALHGCWNGGKMDGFVTAHRAVNRGAGPLTMGHFKRGDIPFYYALADAFTLCDGYHASMMCSTRPNRMYLMTGMIDPKGEQGGPAIDNTGRAYTWETYPERLQAAGISWCIYHGKDDYNCNVTKFFTQYQRAPKTSPLYEYSRKARELDVLLEDLRTGNIPQVTWIVPPSTASEHPVYLPAEGEDYTRRVLDALWSNPALWARTVVILNYDENDGYFDHVAPPTPEKGTAGEFVNKLPIGLGFRVPCMVISPFSRGGYVCSETFDHTSTLRLLETRFGVEVPHLTAWRRATCGDLVKTLGLGEPPRLDVPKFPDTAARLQDVKRTLDSLPKPKVPKNQWLPSQEKGTRPRRGVA